MQKSFGFFRRVATTLALFAVTVSGAPINFETAQNVAQKHLDNKRGGKIKKTTPPKQRDSRQYFVFDKENGGFIIIAADDIAVPILGETDKGTFNPDSVPPALLWMLSNYEEQINAAVKNGVVQDEETKLLWRQTTLSASAGLRAETYPAQLLNTRWGQGEPFNLNTPMDGSTRSLTGCVATAMAQIMKFHVYPLNGTGYSDAYNTKTKNIYVASVNLNEYYDYANMIDYYQYASSGTTTQRNAIARIMFHTGVSVKMDYSKDGSGAYDTAVAPAFKRNFGYDDCIRFIYSNNSKSISAADWKELVLGQIENYSPVYYGGQDVANKGGHAFVIDGYNTSQDKFHINWGWYGNADGYFALTALNPATNDNFQFNNNQSMIINIMPNKNGNAPSQIKLTAFNVSIDRIGIKASIIAKMNYGADFSGKIGFALMSGGTVQRVLDSANYSISNAQSDNYTKLGVYTVNKSTANLTKALGADIPEGDLVLQTVIKRGNGQWTPVGETRILSSTIDLDAVSPQPSGIGWTYANNVYTIIDGANVLVKGAASVDRRIEVASGARANIILQRAEITVTTSYQSAITLDSNSQLSVTLESNSRLTSGSGAPGIKVIESASLIIAGDDTLHIRAGANAAAIGAATGLVGGNITVVGGVLWTQVNGGDVAGISGTFTLDGNAVVHTTSIDAEEDNLQLKNGILFLSDVGTAYGTTVFEKGVYLHTENLSIPSDATVNLPGSSLMCAGGTLNVNGGAILGTDKHAIVNIGGTLNITDGVVFAYGTDISDVIFDTENSPVGSCAIIAWNNEAGNTTYHVLSDEDIFVYPSSVSALWNGKGGIAYENEANKGFFAVEGVSVIKLPNAFVTPAAITTTYSPTLKLGELPLPAGYTWKNTEAAVGAAGNAKSFEAFFAEPSGNYETVQGNIVVNVLKAAGASVLKPILADRTHNSVTLSAVTTSTSQDVEFGISETGLPQSWQTSLTFAQLKPLTNYDVFARAAANDNYNIGEISAALTIKTLSEPYSISKIEKSDSKRGILLKESVVSDSVEFSVILPNDKVLEIKVVIYDNTGNVMFETSGRDAKLSWNLTNGAGRKAANGSYLIVAEVKGAKGTYAYSAKIGVKR